MNIPRKQALAGIFQRPIKLTSTNQKNQACLCTNLFWLQGSPCVSHYADRTVKLCCKVTIQSSHHRPQWWLAKHIEINWPVKIALECSICKHQLAKCVGSRLAMAQRSAECLPWGIFRSPERSECKLGPVSRWKWTHDHTNTNPSAAPKTYGLRISGKPAE